MAGPLKNIKILDLTRHAPGPYCTMILGDLGADILKVEGAVSDLVAPEFPAPNSPDEPLRRNKKSMILNLKKDEGREIFYKLAAEADVIVEGFRPGVVHRLGVDYDTVKGFNEGIIYCSITGYGQDGPYRDLVGHDLNYLAHGGLLGILKSPFLIPGNIVGDLVSGGMQAVIGILAALLSRQTTGKGQYIDIAMTDGIVSLITLYIAKYLEMGRMPDEETRVSIGGTHYYNVYETKDGKFISIASSEARFFANLCNTLGCEQYIPYQFDSKKVPEIKEHFTKIFLTKTRDEWFDILSRNETAVAKVNTIDELVSDPHILNRGMIVEVDSPVHGKVRQVGIPIKLSATPGKIRHLGSRPGEDTAHVLASLGYSEQAIQELSDKGVITMSGDEQGKRSVLMPDKDLRMDKAKKQIPIEKGLFHVPTSSDDKPYLIGSKCSSCNLVTFPKREVCPRCVKRGTMSEYHIYGKGRLNTFSIVNAALPGFKAPSIQAYVDLDEGPRIWSLITGIDANPDALRIGMELELVVEKVREDREGNEYTSYQFRTVKL